MRVSAGDTLNMDVKGVDDAQLTTPIASMLWACHPPEVRVSERRGHVDAATCFSPQFLAFSLCFFRLGRSGSPLLEASPFSGGGTASRGIRSNSSNWQRCSLWPSAGASR